MTEDQNERLKQLTNFLVKKYITESEYIEYQQLSEILLAEMNQEKLNKQRNSNY